MTVPEKQSKTHTEGGRQRGRMHRRLTGKTGKTVGFASIAAPIVGFIVHDLQKPDSCIRRLAHQAMNGFIAWRQSRREAIDITDKVKVKNEQNDQSPVRSPVTDSH